MSKQVDERVVSMQFDNRHFESNVKTTMSTLDKLKQKLHLDGATKGLEGVDKAARKVNMTSLGTAVETVQAKFSALEVMGVTALANLTNSAVNAGKRIVSALAIDPVTTGFQEYETQMNAVQTILANTQSKGSTLDDVNTALDELNEYADQTIYNFTEMTRNIGTFTAAGVDLQTSVESIKGIANLAAVSGSSSQQASTAMYQLSQALAAGKVSLMDWNSVVNAGMGGQLFQDALVRTSELLKTGAKDAIAANGSFRESLTKGEWLTTEVLTETLKQLSGAYTEADLIAQGFTEEQAKEIANLAETATNAATKVKTFTQLWDVMKESAQSGWSQTWKLIVGDFEEAKALLTPLADFFTGVINKMSDARNRVLQIALDFAAPWKAVADKLGNVKKAIESVAGVTRSLEEYQKVVNAVWRGDYKNQPYRYGLLEAAGYDDYRVIQDLVNLGYKHKITNEDVARSQERYGKKTAEATKETEKMNEAVEELTDEKLEDLGLTKEEIRLYRALEKEAKRLNIPMSQLVDEMSNNNGRDMLIESFKNIGGALLDMGKAISSAWNSVIMPPSIEEMGVRLYGMIRTFRDFTSGLRLVNEKTGELTDTGLKFQSVFKGVFALLDIVVTVVGGPLRIILKAVTQLLGYFGLGVLDVAAFIGEAIVKVRDFIDGILDFTKVYEKIVPAIQNGIKAFRDWFATLEYNEDLPKTIAQVIMNGFVTAFNFVKNLIFNFGDVVKDGFGSIGSSAFGKFLAGLWEGVKFAGRVVVEFGKLLLEKLNGVLTARGFEPISLDMISGLVNGLKNGAGKAFQAIWDLGANLIAKIKEVLGIHSPSTVFFAIGGFIIAGLVAGLSSSGSSVLDVIKNIGNWCVELVKSTGEMILELIRNLDFGTVLAGVLAVGMTFAGIKIANALDTFADTFESFFGGIGEIFDSISNYINANALVAKSEAIRNLAISLGILVAAIVVLTLVDQKKMWIAVGALGALVGILGILVGLMLLIGFISSKVEDFGIPDAPILAIAASMLILAIALKKVSEIDANAAKRSIVTLAGVAVGMIAMAAILGLFTRKEMGANLDNAGIMLVKMSVAMLLMMFVIKQAAKLDDNAITRGLGVVMGIELLFLGIVAVSKLAGEHAKEAGKMLMKMSVAMLLMIGVVKLASMLSPSDVNTGMKVIAMVGGMFAALIAVSYFAGEHAKKAGSMLLKMSVAILTMVAVMKFAASLTESEVKQAMGVIALVGGVFTVLIAVSHLAGEHASGAGSMLLEMSFALIILTGVIYLLSLLNPDKLKVALGAIVVLEAVFGGLIAVTHLAKDSKGMSKVLITLIVAIGILGGLLIALSCLDPNKVKVAAGALSAVVGVFALLMYATSFLKSGQKTWWRNLITIISLGVVVTALAGVIIALSNIDPKSATGNAAALSILVMALAGAMTILSNSKSINDKKLRGILGSMVILSGVMVVIGLVLARMSALNVQNAIPNAHALGILVNALASAMLILSLAKGITAKTVGNAMLMGIVVRILAESLAALSLVDAQSTIPNAIALGILVNALAASMLILQSAQGCTAGAAGVAMLMGIVVAELAGVFILLDTFNVAPSISTAIALGILVNALAAACLILSYVGPVAGPALLGALALAGVIAILGGVCVGIGYLMSLIPPDKIEEWKTGLANFMDFLVILAGGLGEAIGAFVGGIAEAIINLFPSIGTALSNFMSEAQGFIDGAKNVDEKTLAGVGILVGAILAFTAADFINGIYSLSPFSAGLPALGTQLSIFMANAKGFIDGAKNIKPETATAVKALCEAILVLTAADFLDGISNIFGGESSLADFGKELELFGPSIAKFAESVSGLSAESLNAMKISAEAGKTLAEMAKTIPNSGGLMGKIFGENDADTFGLQLVSFGKSMVNYGNSVAGLNVEAVETSVPAAKALSDLATNLPDSGGWKAKILGDNTMDTFGAQLTAFGLGLVAYGDTVSTLDAESVEASVPCAQALSDLATNLPNSEGWAAKILGDNTMDTFGTRLVVFGEGLRDYGYAVKDLDTTSILNSVVLGTFLSDLATGLPDSGGFKGWFNGDTDLEEFGQQIVKFGEGLVAYGESISGLDANHLASTSSSVQILSSVAKALSGVDTSGMVAFGNALNDPFGTSFKAYGEKISSVDMSNVITTTSHIQSLATTASSLLCVDTSGLVSFGFNLEIFGDYVKSYGTKISEVPTGTLATTTIQVVRIADMAKGLGGVDYTAMSSFGTNIVDLATSVESYANKMSDVGDIDSGVAKIKNLINVLKSMSGAKGGGISSIVDSLEDLSRVNLNGFVQSFSDVGPKLRNAGRDIIQALLNLMKSKFSDFEKIGKAFATRMSKGFTDGESGLSKTVKSVVSGLVQDTRDKYKSFYNAGSYLVDGFAAGIDENDFKAKAKAKAMAQAALDAAKEVLKINSPSKVFRAIGTSVPEGFAMGIDKLGSLVTDSSDSMANNAIWTVQNSISRIVDLINSDIDSQPTIRPVLDLSDVKTGVDAISSMFNAKSQVGVLANVGSISSMMNSRGQNGGNEEVVSAIKDLRKDISDMPRNTYSINGITYDDGSNISEAVKALVRATRMEGRV